MVEEEDQGEREVISQTQGMEESIRNELFKALNNVTKT